MIALRMRLLVGVVAVLVLREMGVCSIRLVRTCAESHTQMLNLGFADGRPFEWPTKPPDPGFTNPTDEHAGDVILDEFRKQLETTAAVDGRVTALRIDRVATTGCRWLPLYKPMGGAVEASLIIERLRDGVPFTRSRTAKIDVDLSVAGICSARDATDEFAKTVSNLLVGAAAEP